MLIKLDSRFKKNVAGRFGKYSFEVGVLQDGPHKLAKRGERGLKGQDVLKTFAGGPARQISSKPSGLSISDVSQENRKRLGFNYLSAPFKKKSSDIIKFSNTFFKLVFGRSEKKRAENLLQAIVRNPILRGEYGSNSKLTQKIKGFDRSMIDTGQLFKAIKAVCKVRSRV
jgi:hypothetical protein